MRKEMRTRRREGKKKGKGRKRNTTNYHPQITVENILISAFEDTKKIILSWRTI